MAFLFLFLGIIFHWKANQVEKDSMTPEDYRRYCMYASSLGPGAPSNAWMLVASGFYTLFLLSCLFGLRFPL